MSLTKEAKPTAEEIRRKVARYKKLIAEWEATLEILDDPELMESIAAGEADLAAGHTRPWKEIKEDVRGNSCQGG